MDAPMGRTSLYFFQPVCPLGGCSGVSGESLPFLADAPSSRADIPRFFWTPIVPG